MSDHLLMTLIGGAVAALHGGVLLVAVLQLREMRKDPARLAEQSDRQNGLLRAVVEHLAVLRGQR